MIKHNGEWYAIYHARNAEDDGLEGDRRNASDIDGLYKIKWDNGLNFNVYNSALRGSLKAAIEEFSTQYVLGNGGDKEWNEWLGKLDKLGVPELKKIYNEAQKRYDAL